MTRPGLFNFAGPLLPALLPLSLLLAIRGAPSRFLSWVIPFLWVSGFFVTGILKFHLPALVLTLLFAAACLGSGDGVAGKGWPAWLPVLTGVGCFPFLVGLGSAYYPGSGVWTFRESGQAYLERAVRNPYGGLCRWIGRELPKDARILIVGDARGLYYPRSFQTDTGYDLSFLASLAERGLDSGRIWKEVRKMGFTHVVVNAAQGITAASMFPTYPLDSRQWRELDGFFRRGLEPIHQAGYGFVLKVRPDLRPGPDDRQVDPILLFAEPVVRYIDACQRGKYDAAGEYRREVEGLFPYPGEWESDGRFLKAMGIQAP